MEWTCISAILFRYPLQLKIQGLPAAWQFKRLVTSHQPVLYINYLSSFCEFEQILWIMCNLFQSFHYEDSMGKQLKNIISNAWGLCTILWVGVFYRESRHFEVKALWSRSEIEEKLMSPNSQSEAALELADTKPNALWQSQKPWLKTGIIFCDTTQRGKNSVAS